MNYTNPRFEPFKRILPVELIAVNWSQLKVKPPLLSKILNGSRCRVVTSMTSIQVSILPILPFREHILLTCKIYSISCKYKYTVYRASLITGRYWRSTDKYRARYENWKSVIVHFSRVTNLLTVLTNHNRDWSRPFVNKKESARISESFIYFTKVILSIDSITRLTFILIGCNYARGCWLK